MITRRSALLTGTALALSTGCGRRGAAHSGTPESGVVGDTFVVTGVGGVTRVAQLTGPGAVNDTARVLLAGADLGSMFNDGDRTWFLFGDNFGERKPDAVGGTGDIWKSNCLAWTTDTDPSDGIRFDGWILDDLEQVKEIIPGKHQPDGVGEVTKIPTQGWAVEDSLFAGFMSVRHWGDPGKWDVNHAGLARSRDRGQTWEVLPSPRWAPDSGFIQLAQCVVRDGDREWLYLWGIGAGRFGPVRLMRVPATAKDVVTPASYEYYAGVQGTTPRWSSNVADAAVVLDGEIGELSVLWSPQLRRWLLSTTSKGNAVLHEGLSPWGPWSPAHVIASQSQIPGLYSPYLNPRYVSDNGKRLYFTLSVWGPYQVFWYRLDLQTASD